MLITADDARTEWANRIARQSKEIVIIASATNNNEMREELLGYADRLNEQLARIKALPACWCETAGGRLLTSLRGAAYSGAQVRPWLAKHRR